ncbi:MAG: 3-hydroxyacyl-CoA dehydrogenase [Subtercola sp.]|nr:3-hydroxyacyl-CoA dehydrogenase [Subtercola sp.]
MAFVNIGLLTVRDYGEYIMATRSARSERVCIIGAGLMGQGIAQSFALGGWAPVLVDRLPELAEKGLVAVASSLSAAVQADRLSASRAENALSRVSISSDLSAACSFADVIFEAVPESLSIKHEVWAEISAAASVETILATNTSALDIDAISVVVDTPERFLGIHWYNPAQLIPGVEIVPGQATSAATVSRALALMTAVGKKPFVVRNRPGFVGNRLQFALIAEAFRCLEEGVATAENIDEIARSTFGIRLGDFGPIRLADMGGLDTYVSILTYLSQTLGERFAVPALLRDLAERGDVGVKSGQGVFSYTNDEGAALASARDTALARRLDNEDEPVGTMTK